MAKAETEQQAREETPRSVETQEPTPAKRKRGPWVMVLLVAVAVVAIVYGVQFYLFSSTHATTDDANIAGDIIQVEPQVSANVLDVRVSDNQHVKKGDLLVVLDDSSFKTAVAQAQANLDLAIAQEAGARKTTSMSSQTNEAQLEQARGIVEQSAGGVGTAQEDISKSIAARSAASANYQSSLANISAANSAAATASSNSDRSRAAVDSASAQLKSAISAVASAKASLSAAQAAADKANKDATRIQHLFAQGVASAQQADAAQAAAQIANSQVDAANQAVESANSGVARAQSDLQSAKSQLAAAQSSVSQAKAQADAARINSAAARDAVREADVQIKWFQKNLVSAQGKVGQAKGQLSQAKASGAEIQVNVAQQVQASARVEQAKAALEQAKIDLARTRIYAPSDGTVSKKSVSVGSLVQPGAPLMAVIKDEQFWVIGNFKETDLTNMKVQQTVDIHVDALPQYDFKGHVDSIQPGTGATFALLPPENATGNFTKVVQRIPVKITFDAGQAGLDLLRVGMSSTVAVKTK